MLVRAARSGRGQRPKWVLPAAAATVVLLGGAGAVWFFGFRSSEGGGGTDGTTPTPTVTTPVAADSTVGAPGDSLTLRDSLGGADTLVAADSAAAFGPMGFNAVVDSPTAAPLPPSTRPAVDTARAALPPDTVAPDTVPSPIGPPPTVPPTVLPTVIVPPGHAITDEIVVIPGLEVLSVAETRSGGVLGYRVIQRADGDVEVWLVATPANFGGDTTGRGQAQVELQADTAVGSIRIGRYLVEARATMPADVLTGLLRQAIRARPVN